MFPFIIFIICCSKVSFPLFDSNKFFCTFTWLGVKRHTIPIINAGNCWPYKFPTTFEIFFIWLSNDIKESNDFLTSIIKGVFTLIYGSSKFLYIIWLWISFLSSYFNIKSPNPVIISILLFSKFIWLFLVKTPSISFEYISVKIYRLFSE